MRSMFLWRYPWVLPLAALVALGLGGLLGARVAGPRVTDTVTETIAAPRDPARLPLGDASKVPTPRDPQRPGREGSIGDALADGGITFRVRSFRPRRTPPAAARRGTRFYEAEVEWRNGTRSAQTLFCGSGAAVLLDQEDNGYEIEDEEGLEARSAKDDRCGQQNPGSGDTATVTYELPPGRRPAGLAMWNPSDEADPRGESYVLVRLPRRS